MTGVSTRSSLKAAAEKIRVNDVDGPGEGDHRDRRTVALGDAEVRAAEGLGGERRQVGGRLEGVVARAIAHEDGDGGVAGPRGSER